MLHHCMWHPFIGTHLWECDIDDPLIYVMSPLRKCAGQEEGQNGLLYCLLILIIIRTQKVDGYLDTWIADISIITKALFSLTWKIQFLTLQSNINDGQSKRYEDSVDVHAVLQCRRLCDILGTPYKSAHTTKSLYGKEIKSLLIQ